MPATNGDVAMGAVVDLWTAAVAAAVDPDPLVGLEVSYAYNGQSGPKVVFGGRWTFVQQDGVEERGVLREEVVEALFVVRVTVRPVLTMGQPTPDPHRAADAELSQIMAGLLNVLRAHPSLDGAIRWLDMTRGASDYAPLPDELIRQRSFTLQLGSTFGWGA